MAFPWRVRNFFTNWRVSFGQTIEGVDVDVIQGSTPAGMIGTIYLDKKTGLVRRYIRYANTMVGRIPTQVEFQNYRDVNGVKLPFTYSYAWVSERDDWTMTGYEVNPAIDNAKFGRPDPKTAGDVAGKLHDELRQELTALKYELVQTSAQLVDAGLPRHLVDRLLSLIGVVELTTSAVRRIAQDLRPPALDL